MTEHTLHQVPISQETIHAGRIDTYDIDEHSEVSALQADFDKLSPGDLHIINEYIQIPGLMIYRQQINQRIRMQGTGPDDWLMLGAIATPRSRVELNRDGIDANHLVVLPPKRELELSILEHSNPIVMMISPDLLAKYLDEEPLTKLLGHSLQIKCAPEFNSWLANNCNQLINRHLRLHTAPIDNPDTGAMTDELLVGLAGQFDCGHSGPDRDTKAKRHRALRLALEYAEKSSNQRITMPELARIAGASQRTLDYAFHEAYALSPLKFIKLHRLNHLHRQLLDTEPGSKSITQVAAALGFSEFGHLSVEYRQLFGESPSHTLKKTTTHARQGFIDLLKSADIKRAFSR